jgi:1-aminocyclopropane-1-carboxylate deaminase
MNVLGTTIPNSPIAIKNSDVSLFVKREDLIHPFISGNKYRKLKYNILEAKRLRSTTVLTFGGAFSNHIAATAYAGKAYGLKTVGVIRGDELAAQIQTNPTLKFAKACGMDFHFISRAQYQHKMDPNFHDRLNKLYGDFYLIPEGGTNALAVKGCEEILTEGDEQFDIICCCVGTGGTIAGLINESKPHQRIIGFPALKGDFLREDIRKFATQDNWELMSDYHFGGYAKIKPELIAFINRFKTPIRYPWTPYIQVK